MGVTVGAPVAGRKTVSSPRPCDDGRVPEGDTVLWTARRLDAALGGRTVLRSDLRVPRFATVDLAGREVHPVATHGKHLMHRFSGGVTMHTHLKMEGRWRTVEPDDPQVRRAERAHTTRVLLHVDGAVGIGSALGVVEVLPTDREADVVGHLGPDLLADDVDPESLVPRVVADDRPVAEVLLDQRVVAGLGTFWVSELLFAGRVHPWTPAADVPSRDVGRFLADARRLMLRSARSGVQSSTGSERPGATKRMHARSGLPCVRCNGTVRVAPAGPQGRERTIFYCPTCQGGLAPGDDGRRQQVLLERSRGRRPRR